MTRTESPTYSYDGYAGVACGLDIGFYTRRERALTEVFPWDFIDIGVTKAFLKREWLRAVNEGLTTPNCRVSCAGCGAARYGKGVCFEKRGEVTA